MQVKLRPPTFKAIQFTGFNLDELKAEFPLIPIRKVVNLLYVGDENEHEFSLLSQGDYLVSKGYDFAVLNEKDFNEQYEKI